MRKYLFAKYPFEEKKTKQNKNCEILREIVSSAYFKTAQFCEYETFNYQ